MFRVGEGYDVHKLVVGRELIIGGVKIDYEKGLYGHSDADVLIHAIIDALLGSAGLDDIGKHFPDTDDKYKNIDSILLLKETKKILQNNIYHKKFNIINIDSTIVCQKPKLRNYINEMKDNIANALDIDVSRVNIKATTEEGLGFTGSGDGISARAICLVDEM